MCGWREILPMLAEAAVRNWVACSGSCPFAQLHPFGQIWAQSINCCDSAAAGSICWVGQEYISPSLALFYHPSASWLWNSDMPLLFYRRWLMFNVCSKQAGFLGHASCSAEWKKGKEALKWTIKPSLQCSENKSLSVAKKKNQLAVVQKLSFPCIPCLDSHLLLYYSSTNWYQLEHGNTCQMEALWGWPGHCSLINDAHWWASKRGSGRNLGVDTLCAWAHKPDS